MSQDNDSVKKTIIVATLLCLVCSIMVSVAAVYLRPIQDRNQALDRKKNILSVAGLYQEGADLDAIFAERVKAHVLTLTTGDYDSAINADEYDEGRALKDPSKVFQIPADEDIGGIKRHPKKVTVYEVYTGDKIDQVILPVYGKGLWSTLYGFLSVKNDGNTINGLAFYKHGETPGLGAEVDNPAWKKQWVGKKIHDENGDINIQIIKGTVDTSRPDAIYKVDGLSGATITAVGVHNFLRYWLGKRGFQKYLERLREGKI